MCPNFRAFPDIVELNTKNIAAPKKNPIISPIIEIQNNKELKEIAETTAKELGRRFTIQCISQAAYQK